MMSVGMYHPAASVIHRIPTGAKLTFLFAAALAVQWADRPWQVGTALVATLCLYAVARIPLSLLIDQIRSLTVLAIVIGLFQWRVSGWQTAVDVIGVLTVLVLLAALVSLSSTTTSMVDAITAFSTPLRFIGLDPDRIGLILALGVRLVPVVLGLAEKVREAQVARGFGADPVAFAVPFVVRCLRHADALGEALAARGVDD